MPTKKQLTKSLIRARSTALETYCDAWDKDKDSWKLSQFGKSGTTPISDQTNKILANLIPRTANGNFINIKPILKAHSVDNQHGATVVCATC